MFTQIAPAKINLYLHVGPVRKDGYHELASLFVFADQGDIITVEKSECIGLLIDGPYSEALKAFPIPDNLVYRAAHLLRDRLGLHKGAKITLTKNLPIAAGIGGGSADAAAALRALMRLWEIELAPDILNEIAFCLGADVPACLWEHPVFVSGAGEVINDGPTLPPLAICLVNPGVATPTGPIFKSFDQVWPNPAKPLQMFYQGSDYDELVQALAATSNDLQNPAINLVPEIAPLLDFLGKQDGVLLSRMSGSGATCFGLFKTLEEASIVAKKANAMGYWSLAANIKD